MKPLVLIGGGGHCRACIDVIEAESSFKIAGIVDNHLPLNHDVLGYKIIGCDNDLFDIVNDIPNAVITIGFTKTPKPRMNIYAQLKALQFNLPTIVSPNAYVAKAVTVGEGSFVLHGAILNTAANIGVNTIINTMALIEHDAVIGDHCHISTASVVNGSSKVGNGVFVGSNAVIVNNLSVPDREFVKANSLYRGAHG